MKLSEVKIALQDAQTVHFQLEDGSFVPESFHVTEIGSVEKRFIDCGGTLRSEKKVSFQLWNADDFEHRLKPKKLLNIISLSEKMLGLQDDEVEVEYQHGTIGKYNLGWNGETFLLTNMQTACLASDACGLPQPKQATTMKELQTQTACCTPGGGCC